jgi:hypothetical protein
VSIGDFEEPLDSVFLRDVDSNREHLTLTKMVRIGQRGPIGVPFKEQGVTVLIPSDCHMCLLFVKSGAGGFQPSLLPVYRHCGARLPLRLRTKPNFLFADIHHSGRRSVDLFNVVGPMLHANLIITITPSINR